MDSLARSGDESLVTWVLVGGGILSLFVLLGIPVLLTLVVIRQRATSLDAVFTPLGLRGGNYLIYGRHYQGQVAGREMDVYLYRGPTIELRVQTRVFTRLQIFHRDSIPAGVARMWNKRPLASPPGLEEYVIYPLDESWAGGWLGAEQVAEAIRTLMTVGAEWAVFRTVELQPGEVVLHLYRSRGVFGVSLPPQVAFAWLTSLQTLAAAAEAQPAPSITAEPPRVALRQSRERVNNIQKYAIGFIVFVMPLCFIAIGALVFLLASLN
jgi:hypothetical protein